MEGRLRVLTAGATHKDLTLILAIEVQQDITRHEALLHGLRTGQAGLLIHREQALDRAMLDILRSQQGQLSGYTDAIVRTQGRAIRTQPLAIDHRLDRVVVEVMLRIVVLLADHIHVRLQHHHRAILHTRSGRLRHQDVANGVFLDGDVMRLSERLQESDHFALLLRRTGHFCYLMEVFPYDVRS